MISNFLPKSFTQSKFYYKQYLTLEMLLWLCDKSAVDEVSEQSKPITQPSLLPDISEEVIEQGVCLDALQKYFSADAWMAIKQKGDYMNINKNIMHGLTPSVAILKLDWKCSNCTVITTRQNMIACDSCDRWYHW